LLSASQKYTNNLEVKCGWWCSDLISKLSLVERSEAELKERILALEACDEDLRHRLQDRDQAHACIQAKLQVILSIQAKLHTGSPLYTGQTTYR